MWSLFTKWICGCILFIFVMGVSQAYGQEALELDVCIPKSHHVEVLHDGRLVGEFAAPYDTNTTTHVTVPGGTKGVIVFRVSYVGDYKSDAWAPPVNPVTIELFVDGHPTKKRGVVDWGTNTKRSETHRQVLKYKITYQKESGSFRVKLAQRLVVIERALY